MQDDHAEENVGVAAHETDPAGLSLENHEDGEIDYAGGEGGAAADKTAEGDAFESRVLVVSVGVET